MGEIVVSFGWGYIQDLEGKKETGNGERERWAMRGVSMLVCAGWFAKSVLGAGSVCVNTK